ncbi:MAG: hypothetical protein Ct9H90mP6_08510 [Gammaproteobacteria bacterium]|nr:MAG: hypothetical protein Ct9H90mP6_08510 [Gammaproteobacteria bacterium]
MIPFALQDYLSEIFYWIRCKGAIFAVHIFLYQFRVIDLANIIPLWLMWVLAFVLIDLVFYIYHRLSHRVRFLWAIHMSHHSSEEMNFAYLFDKHGLRHCQNFPFFAVCLWWEWILPLLLLLEL